MTKYNSILTISLSLFLFAIGSSLAQSPQQEKPQKHLKQYFVEKYKNLKDVSSTLEDTPNGPKGRIHISGQIKPDNVPVLEGDRAWERGMAKGFFQQEAPILGVSNIDEIQERKVETTTGYYGDTTHIYYHRVINGLVLENSDYHVVVDSTRNISSVSAEVVPAPPELYEASKRASLDEDKAKKIVDDNLKAVSKNYKINKIEKIASPNAPYVVWLVDVTTKDTLGRWKYRIDAFSGEILDKKNALVNSRRPVKGK